MLRRASGRPMTSAVPSDSFWAADTVSMSGARTDTVTVSASWPTSIVKVCRTVCPAPNSRPSFE